MHAAIVRAEWRIVRKSHGYAFRDVSTRATLLGPKAPVALKRLVLFCFAHHHHPSHICLSESVVNLATRGAGLARRASKLHHPAISPRAS